MTACRIARMRFAFERAAAAVAIVAFALASTSDAGAVGTRTFTLDTLEKLSGGDLKGVAVDSAGRVRAGYNLGTSSAPQAHSIWSAWPQTTGTLSDRGSKARSPVSGSSSR